MSEMTLEMLTQNSRGKRTNEIPWYMLSRKMAEAIEPIATTARQMGESPEAKAVNAAIEQFSDLHAQFVEIFGVLHAEISEAETGLGCLVKAMSKLDGDDDIGPDEFSYLINPLHKRLCESTSLLYMLVKG